MPVRTIKGHGLAPSFNTISDAVAADLDAYHDKLIFVGGVGAGLSGGGYIVDIENTQGNVADGTKFVTITGGTGGMLIKQLEFGQSTTYLARYETDPVAVAEVGTIGLIDPALPRCQLGIKFFDGSSEQVTPSAGTVALAFKTDVNGVWEDFEVVPDLDATAPVTFTFWAGLTDVRATPTGITGAVTYKIVLLTTEA